MTIADQITRLTNAKAAIKESIENKGVDVSDTALLDEYPALIDKIEVGSGGSGDTTTYEHPDFYELRTIGGTDYAGLFHSYSGRSLDLSNFNTSNVEDMSYMFYYCLRLEQLDLSNFNTSNVENMSYMFYSSPYLTQLDLSNFNTSNVEDMSYMFYNCNSLTSLDLSSFDTSKVINMSHMFRGCESLTTLDVSSFDTSNVTSMIYMFNNCESLTTLDVSSFDTSKVTSFNNTFAYCESLTSLDLSNWDVSKATSFSSAFFNCTALTDLQAPKNINAPIDVSKCPNLTHDSLMSIINNLATVTSTKKLTLGTTNLAKLTNEEKAIATNKGWTLA